MTPISKIELCSRQIPSVEEAISKLIEYFDQVKMDERSWGVVVLCLLAFGFSQTEIARIIDGMKKSKSLVGFDSVRGLFQHSIHKKD